MFETATGMITGRLKNSITIIAGNDAKYTGDLAEAGDIHQRAKRTTTVVDIVKLQ